MKLNQIVAFFVMIMFFCTLLPFQSIGGGYSTLMNNSRCFKASTTYALCASELDMFLAYNHGYSIGLQYFHLYHLVNFFVNSMHFKYDVEIVESEADHQKQLIRCYFPEYLEELNGLACATHISVDRLIELHVFLSSLLTGECTITASTAPATKYNQTFLTQNWDMPSSILEFFIWRMFFVKTYYIHHQPSHYRYMFLGIPLLYEHPLLNEKGLGWGGTGTPITSNISRQVDEGDGMPIYLLVRKTMMTCKNVSNVADLWRNTPRSSHKFEVLPQDWDYDSYVFCDREGGILMIEQTHSYLATVFGTSTELTGSQEGILWHTNHHLWLDPLKTGSRLPSEHYKSYASLIRAERTRELLEVSWGNITLESCMNLTRDHEGGMNSTGPDSADICRHPDDLDDTATVLSWIIEPQSFSVYMTEGYPCSTPFQHFNFSEEFK